MNPFPLRRFPLRLVAVVVILLASPAFSARAEIGSEELNLELHGGYQGVGLYSDAAFGVRAGRSLYPNFGVESSVIVAGERTFLDLSAVWFANPDHRAVFYLLGGAGALFADYGDESEELAMAHVGLGSRVQLSERFYVRVEARGHMPFERLTVVQWNASVGVGIKVKPLFGRGRAE